jgi:hypothetical protein
MAQLAGGIYSMDSFPFQFYQQEVMEAVHGRALKGLADVGAYEIGYSWEKNLGGQNWVALTPMEILAMVEGSQYGYEVRLRVIGIVP